VPRAPGRAAGNQIREEVVEEEVSIGKRPVERPAARVSSEVTERPVEEKVQLDEEQVHIDRRKADRPASEEDLRPNEDIVIQERSEQQAVQKRARVVGEGVVSKEARDPTETIREKVRRKDVHVDKEPGGAAPGYGSLESDFREHHRKHDHSGLDYADAE